MFLSSAVSSPCVCCLMFLFRLQTLPSKRNGGRRCRKGTTARVQPSSCKVVISSVFFIHRTCSEQLTCVRSFVSTSCKPRFAQTNAENSNFTTLWTRRAGATRATSRTKCSDATRRRDAPAHWAGAKGEIIYCCVLCFAVLLQHFQTRRVDATRRPIGPAQRMKH